VVIFVVMQDVRGSGVDAWNQGTWRSKVLILGRENHHLSRSTARRKGVGRHCFIVL
jgi:hypothetical protein